MNTELSNVSHVLLGGDGGIAAADGGGGVMADDGLCVHQLQSVIVWMQVCRCQSWMLRVCLQMSSQDTDPSPLTFCCRRIIESSEERRLTEELRGKELLFDDILACLLPGAVSNGSRFRCSLLARPICPQWPSC